MNLSQANLPQWIAGNGFFQTLFLLRKVFLTRNRIHHYAQFAEDVCIRSLLPRTDEGFFVDVGCYHPRKFNNTWALYRRGWRGVNIDVDDIKVKAFNLVRPQDVNIHAAVSDAQGDIRYWSNGLYSLTTSVSADYVADKPGYIEKTAPARQLTDILDATRFKDRAIDFLSVDAEGHDLEVLHSLDFARYSPSLIAVETHKALLSEVVETELYQFLVAKGYGLVGWCGLTLLMANTPLQATLAAEALRR